MVGSRRFASTLTAASIVAIAALGVLSCLGPTQLTLELSTDVPCSSVRGVSITVGATPESVENARPSTTTQSCSGGGYIGTIAVTPAAERNGRIAIRAVLGVDVPADQCTAESKYKGCIVVRRELAFVPHNTLLVPIGFYSVCRDVACTGTSTCKGPEGCVSSVTNLGAPKPQDGGSTPSDDGPAPAACKSPADCPAIKTSPADCAEPLCDLGRCIYLAKDADGDKDPSANCSALDAKVVLKRGTDCDDTDPNINGNAKRACGTGACAGFQTCEANGTVGPCVGAAPGVFNCGNGLDNDCNGVIDADELMPIGALDKNKVCANLYRCPKGTVQPDRVQLCRNANGQYTLDCSTFVDSQHVGYAAVSGTASPGANSAFLYIKNTRDLVYPVGVSTLCCPAGLCGGSQFCTANAPIQCGLTSLTPAP